MRWVCGRPGGYAPEESIAVALSTKYGSLVTPISTAGKAPLFSRCDCRSCAKHSIMTRRSANEAGFDGLSAFCVARRRSNRDDTGVDLSRNGELAMWRWATVGGLKEESSTKRVCGGGDGGCAPVVEVRISKDLVEAMKRLRAVE